MTTVTSTIIQNRQRRSSGPQTGGAANTRANDQANTVKPGVESARSRIRRAFPRDTDKINQGYIPGSQSYVSPATIAVLATIPGGADHWRQIQPVAGATDRINSLAANTDGSVLVGVGASGRLIVSTDRGATWTSPSSLPASASHGLQDVAYGNGYWVVIGTNSASTNIYAAYATDPLGTWTSIDPWSGTGNWPGIAVSYVNGWWAISDNSITMFRQSDPTGVWTTTGTSPAPSSICDMLWDGTRYVAYCGDGRIVSRANASPIGAWVENQTIPFANWNTQSLFSALAWDGGSNYTVSTMLSTALGASDAYGGGITLYPVIYSGALGSMTARTLPGSGWERADAGNTGMYFPNAEYYSGAWVFVSMKGDMLRTTDFTTWDIKGRLAPNNQGCYGSGVITDGKYYFPAETGRIYSPYGMKVGAPPSVTIPAATIAAVTTFGEAATEQYPGTINAVTTFPGQTVVTVTDANITPTKFDAVTTFGEAATEQYPATIQAVTTFGEAATEQYPATIAATTSFPAAYVQPAANIATIAATTSIPTPNIQPVANLATIAATTTFGTPLIQPAANIATIAAVTTFGTARIQPAANIATIAATTTFGSPTFTSSVVVMAGVTRLTGTNSPTGKIVYGEDLWVGVDNFGFTYSTNGTSWTTATNPFGVNPFLQRVAYGNGMFVAVGLSNRLATSPDGINWTAHADPGFGTGESISWVEYGSDGYWVAVGGNGKLATATDPTGTWTQRSPGMSTSSITTVGHDGTYWVIAGSSGRVRYATDPTGTWSAAPSNPFNSGTNYALWVNGRWVVCGSHTTNFPSGAVVSATDPTGSWTTVATGFLVGAAYGAGRLALFATPNGYEVWTDGITLTLARFTANASQTNRGYAEGPGFAVIVTQNGGSMATWGPMRLPTTFGAPTVTTTGGGTDVNITPTHFIATTSVAGGDTEQYPPTVNAVVSFPQAVTPTFPPTINAVVTFGEAATEQYPATIGATTSFPAPTVSGSALATPALISVVTSVAGGATEQNPATILAITSFGEAATEQYPATIGAVTTFPAPTMSTGSTVSPSSVSAVTSIPAATSSITVVFPQTARGQLLSTADANCDSGSNWQADNWFATNTLSYETSSPISGGSSVRVTTSATTTGKQIRARIPRTALPGAGNAGRGYFTVTVKNESSTTATIQAYLESYSGPATYLFSHQVYSGTLAPGETKTIGGWASTTINGNAMPSVGLSPLVLRSDTNIVDGDSLLIDDAYVEYGTDLTHRIVTTFPGGFTEQYPATIAAVTTFPSAYVQPAANIATVSAVTSIPTPTFTSSVTVKPPLLYANRTKNIMSANQASAEDGVTTGWTSQHDCSIAASTAQAYDGTYSIAATATGTGTGIAFGMTNIALPCWPGEQYTYVVYTRAATTPRNVQLQIYWRDAWGVIGGAISSSSGSVVSNTTSGWTQHTVTATAPAGAFGAIGVINMGTSPGVTLANGEVHYADAQGFWQGSSTDWVLPAGLPFPEAFTEQYPASIGATVTFGAPAFTSSATATPAVISATTTVAGGATEQYPASILAIVSFGQATTEQYPATVNATVSMPAPTMSTGATTTPVLAQAATSFGGAFIQPAQGTTIQATTTFGAPTFTSSVSITPATIDAPTTVGGGTTEQYPATIAAAVTFGAPVLAAGSTATPARVNAPVTFGGAFVSPVIPWVPFPDDPAVIALTTFGAEWSFTDDFERPNSFEIGNRWYSTGGPDTITDGVLTTEGAVHYVPTAKTFHGYAIIDDPNFFDIELYGANGDQASLDFTFTQVYYFGGTLEAYARKDFGAYVGTDVSVTPSAGDLVEFEVDVASHLKVWINGTLVATVSNAVNTFSSGAPFPMGPPQRGFAFIWGSFEEVSFSHGLRDGSDALKFFSHATAAPATIAAPTTFGEATPEQYPGTIHATVTFGAPSLEGAVNVTPAHLSAATTFGAPTFTSSVAITPATVDASTTISGEVEQYPATVAATTTFGAPAFTSSITATPGSASAVVSFGGETVRTSATATPAVISAAVTVHAPIVVEQPTPASIPATVSFAAPTLSMSTLVTPPVVTATTSVGAPSRRVEPATISAPVTFGTHTVTTGTTATPARISAVTTFGGPTLEGSALVSPALIQATTSVGSPGIPVGLQGAVVSAFVTISAPGLSTSVLLAPTVITGTTSFGAGQVIVPRKRFTGFGLPI